VELATFGQITGKFLAQQVSPFAARISSVVVTWSLLAVRVNAHGVCTISLQAAVHPLSGPHTTTKTLEVQPEDGSSCTGRNIMLEDIIENTFQ
jgi:hypothetical protein